MKHFEVKITCIDDDEVLVCSCFDPDHGELIGIEILSYGHSGIIISESCARMNLHSAMKLRDKLNYWIKNAKE